MSLLEITSRPDDQPHGHPPVRLAIPLAQVTVLVDLGTSTLVRTVSRPDKGIVACEPYEEVVRRWHAATPRGGGGKPPRPAYAPGTPCPQCSKPLVSRTGANGPFIGCSGYPDCRFTGRQA